MVEEEEVDESSWWICLVVTWPLSTLIITDEVRLVLLAEDQRQQPQPLESLFRRCTPLGYLLWQARQSSRPLLSSPLLWPQSLLASRLLFPLQQNAPISFPTFSSLRSLALIPANGPCMLAEMSRPFGALTLTPIHLRARENVSTFRRRCCSLVEA